MSIFIKSYGNTQAYTIKEIDSYISLKETISRNTNIPSDVFYLTNGVHVLGPEINISSLKDSTLDLVIPCPAGSLNHIPTHIFSSLRTLARTNHHYILSILKKALNDSRPNTRLCRAIQDLFCHFRYCHTPTVDCRYCKFIVDVVELHRSHCSGCLLCDNDSPFYLYFLARQNM